MATWQDRALPALPIDAGLSQIVEALRGRGALVLSAEPGAGKTTRVPRALLDAGFGEHGEIVVLQPRRIAARMAARRVALELGEEVGGRVGYQVRYEDVSSARTRVRFVTEGILTRKLASDPQLRGVTAVVLDEFHERSLHADVALALLRRLRRSSRPDLTLCVMSATLAREPLAQFLDAAVLEVAGRPHPVTIEHAPLPSDARLSDRVAGALRRLLDAGLDGDVLVFLPGAAEIRRAQEACAPIVARAGMELALLHGDLPAHEQDQAVARSDKRKLILSTNVAETSLTIEGVVAVIDSGLARVAGHSPFSGLPTLITAPISRASAKQRAGRAGRLREGRCVRLYTKHDHDVRPEHDTPELLRADLAETLLCVSAAGQPLGADEWLEPPPPAGWHAAGELLTGLGALTGGELTAQGRRMAALPLHPRLSRLLLASKERGVAASGALLSALLGERDVLLSARARFGERARDHETGSSDLLHRLELLELAGERATASQLRGYDLDPGAVSAVRRARDRLHRMVGGARDDDALTDPRREQALLASTLIAFFDRVARRRAPRGSELVFAGGGSALIAPQSVVRDAEHVVVVDAAQHSGTGRAVTARLLSAIDPLWLLELFPERVKDQTELSWNDRSGRVEALQVLRYDGLELDRSERPADPGAEVSALLASVLRARGLDTVFDMDAVCALREKLRFAASVDASVPQVDDALLERALVAACAGATGLAQLARTALVEALHAELGAGLRARLQALLPEQVELPHGRRLQVHYERDKPPWVQSRLQDFFGMNDGPEIGGRPVVLHLLAPNHRAVQVTTDLAGFWRRHYPEVRRELMRRYPRHAWPEDPLHASPPVKRARR